MIQVRLALFNSLLTVYLKCQEIEDDTNNYQCNYFRVNARGKALNAAMGSLHSFDRSLDKFMAWLSDTESSLESLELELDSYGPGVKTSRDKVLAQLKVRHIFSLTYSLSFSFFFFLSFLPLLFYYFFYLASLLFLLSSEEMVAAAILLFYRNAQAV